ncbi:hypothetical protein MBGDC06_00641, partial [Thermoplasmatales archaeon SCGC AB-539-C06]
YNTLDGLPDSMPLSSKKDSLKLDLHIHSCYSEDAQARQKKLSRYYKKRDFME